MYTRRQLLTRGTTLLLLVPVVGPILGCSSSSSNSGPDAATCAGVSSTSSVTGQHTHTLCVLTTDLTSPPAAGVNYTTSLDSGHTHHVALTAANLTSINSGQTVMVTSTTDNNHSHTFAITKA
jgi:hypothetical protein